MASLTRIHQSVGMVGPPLFWVPAQVDSSTVKYCFVVGTSPEIVRDPPRARSGCGHFQGVS